ncbi:methionine ABC transporter permease [Enterococcus timonensis]|uniref:methionine ABC transporter permease n=1 Tax=Enterococcus timonensis TaxID=1852364 RepID=UPI0008DB0153|nr:ABC transporter permease subunit [Enterococcus timonensis]
MKGALNTYFETLNYYAPELLKSLQETGIMLGIAAVIGGIGGLFIGTAIFFVGKNRLKPHRVISAVLNFYVNVTRSFPFLLFVVALIPLTRFLLGSAFGPLAASFPLSLVSLAIFSRLVEQVLLDVPTEVFVLADSLGATSIKFIWKMLFVEARSGLILSFTSTMISLVSYSTVMGVVGGGGIGDFALRYGYQRYEYGIMYTAIVIMILFVFALQFLGTHLAVKLDKRK